MKKANHISIKSCLDAWNTKHQETTRLILNAHIYEYYCYDTIIRENPNVHIILAKTQKSQSKNGFIYKNNGSIYYSQHEIDLAEFDILGLDDNGKLYWWEATVGNSNELKILQKLRKKTELVGKLFDDVNFTVIVPEEREFLHDYTTMVIPPPNYEDFYKDYFELTSDMSNCWPIDELNRAAKHYDYIGEIISLSKKFFANEITEYKSKLIERLYNLDDFGKNEINYYNVRRKLYGKIITKGSKKYKVEGDETKLIEKRKATNFELRLIAKRLMGNSKK